MWSRLNSQSCASCALCLVATALSEGTGLWSGHRWSAVWMDYSFQPYYSLWFVPSERQQGGFIPLNWLALLHIWALFKIQNDHHPIIHILLPPPSIQHHKFFSWSRSFFKNSSLFVFVLPSSFFKSCGLAVSVSFLLQYTRTQCCMATYLCEGEMAVNRSVFDLAW